MRSRRIRAGWIYAGIRAKAYSVLVFAD
jgi:hypothetical protein